MLDVSVRYAVGHATDFSSSGLIDADFEYSKLPCANFFYVGLQGADFQSVDLSNSSFNGAKLWGVDFSDSILSNASFRGAELHAAKLDCHEASGADFKDARLEHTFFFDIDLTKTSGLVESSIESTFGVQAGQGLVQLPTGLPYPKHWFESNELGQYEVSEPFRDAYRQWITSNPLDLPPVEPMPQEKVS